MGLFNKNKDILNSYEDIDNEGKFNKKILFIILGILLCLIIIVIIWVFVSNEEDTNIVDNYNEEDNGSYIHLIGDTNISIYLGSEYVEPGYQGYDRKNTDLTDDVIVTNNVDTSKIGTYTVTYTLNETVVTRTVNVVEKPVGATYIYLYDIDELMILNVGEKYQEPGYVVVDTVDNNLTDKVVIDSNVDTSKPGNYQVVYSVVNSSGITTTAIRKVEVLGGTINLSLSTNKSTKDPVNVKVSIEDNNFDYLILPSGNKVSEKTYSYKVDGNGTYKFIYYDKYGNKTEKSITVSNIIEVVVSAVKVYTSDNIASGNKHDVGFLIKLKSDAKTIYYCLDSNNTCEPNTKYTEQLRFASSQQKYLRYKSCDEDGYCNKPQSYKINLSISLVNPDVSTSTSSKKGIANPYQAAYYYQADSRWANYYVYGSYKMRQVGCGFNAFSMIVTGITHDYKYTPDEVYNTLKQIKKDYGVIFQDSYTGGGLLDTAVVDKNVSNYFGYETSVLWKYKFGASKDSSSLIAEKKEKIISSLEMGHMILLRVPNHFIALVGINENNKIYVFDSGSTGAHMNDIDGIFEDYYYRVSTSYGIECNIALAYEIYPSGGISLENWQDI